MSKKIKIVILLLVLLLVCGCTKNKNSSSIESRMKPFQGTYIKSEKNETYKGIIYLDPTNFTKKCTEKEANKNLNKYNTPTEIKTGCMKFYIFEETDDSYKMILDHNTTARINYSNMGNNDYDTSNVKKEVKKLTVKYNWLVEARLITMEEINQIVGKEAWENKMNNGYFFDTLNQQKAIFSDNNRSKYDWLFNYLNQCKSDLTDYGCKIEDNNEYTYYNPKEDTTKSYTYGYWTSTSVQNDDNHILQWIIRYSNGPLDSVADESGHGIRPVIELKKSIIEA